MTPEAEDPADRSLESGNPESPTATNAAERVIERFGGIRPMAAKVEVPVTTVQGWKKRGVIPASRHGDIRAAASRHGVQLDSAELAAADADEEENGSATATTAAGADATGVPSGAGSSGRADGVGVAVAASLIAVIAAIAAATAPLWTPRLFAQPRGGTGELAQEMQGLNGRLGAVEQRIPPDPSARVGALEQALAAVRASVEALPREAASPATPDSAVIDRLARLEQRLEAAAAPVSADPGIAERVSRLDQRVEAVATQMRDLQASSGQGAAVAQSVQALAGTVRELQGSTEELRRALASVQSRYDELAARFKQAQEQDMRAEAAALALGHLRIALQGSEPFGAELATVRSLTVAPSPGVGAALDRVAPFAATGAPTRAQLRQRFEPLARAIVRAEGSTADASWTEQTLGRIASLVTIRRAAGETEGNSAVAVVARAEARFQADDLSGAVEALGALSGKSAELAAPWVQQARARLAFEQAAAEIGRAAIARLGAAAQPAAPQPAPARPAQ